MPFKLPSISGRASNDQHKQQEASLDDILPNRNQRIDLIVLVILCTNHMRANLAATFEKARLQGHSDSETSLQTPHAIRASDTDIEETGLDSQWIPNMGLSSTKMQNLKKAGITHFDGWRNNVLKRMGEALSISQDSIKAVKVQFEGVTSKKENHGGQGYAQEEGKPAATTEETVKVTLPFPQVALPPQLGSLDDKRRALVLGAMLFMLLSLEHYPAQSRTLLAYLCRCFDLPCDVLSSEETTTAATLLDAASRAEGIDAEEARKKQADEGAFGRKWKIGLATVAGAAVIGISGGLAAPLILGVAGTIMGGIGLGGLATLLGATIANPVTIAALFGALGGRMTGRAMETYSKEVEDFKFLPLSEVKPLSETKKTGGSSIAQAPAHKLRVAIGISGWVTKESDVSLPWRVFSAASLEPFSLRYEQAALISLSTTLDKVLKDTAFGYVQSYAVKLVLPTLAAAMAPIGLLKSGKFLDNPFSIAMDRSDKAGRVLARALIDKAQGERPVTLVGFSMGARVVYSCLEELAAQNAFGLVENAILIGSPVPSAEMSWRRMRSVVSSRLINVYTQRDVLLGFLYRARNAQLGIAGLQAIASVPAVENIDVSHIVTGHNQYRLAVGRILKELNFADLDMDQVEQENVELEHEKLYEQEMYNEAKQDGRLEGLEDEHGQIFMGNIQDHEKSSESEAGISDKEHAQKPRDLHIEGLEEKQSKPALPARPST